MVLLNLRSLLAAAIVLSNCITWTASRHHYTHNVSGHRSRHRRQGKGLYLMSSYVIPGGEGTGWGEWGETSPCSRTCGGGVASQKRICLQFGPDGQPQCTGGDTKYFSCETQDCPPGSGDFRAEQCSSYNNVTYRGIRYKWKPYTKGPNPCELNCMPPGERFYYRHQDKVIDGTRCSDESFDVCVNGTCQPVGCDLMLGSNAREDKCRHCRGNGKNCYTTNGLLDTQDLIKGYNDMMLIPEGATSIVIMEVKPSNNYLALRAKNGTYYLNGDYHIDFPRSMMIAGALWYYERSQQGFAAPDKLRCLGPINEPIYLALLLQSENVGIEYEYSLPTELAPRPIQKYNWVHEDFTPCSTSCGGGYQTRNVSCRTEIDLDVVDDALCDDGLKPPTNQTCNNQACPPQWVTDEWGPCSKRCGEGGTQSREIRCQKIIMNGYPSIVSDKECFDLLGPKPEKFQECNVNTTCPQWFTEPWKPCDKEYGEGKQTRRVICYQKNGRRIEVLEDSECAEEKPETEKSCMKHSDKRTDWMTSNWFGCDNCLSTVRTRIAKCTTYDRGLVNDSFCSHHPLPVLQEPCDPDKLPPCEVQWYATQWGKCSTECGEGIQSRSVFCGMFMKDTVMKVEESRCSHLPKYNDTKPCFVPKELCPSQWYTAPWTKCSKECGGGEQFRHVMCLRGLEPALDCDGRTVPDSVQACNTGPCNKDEIMPLNVESTPIFDEEECEDEEDYPEVGLDIILPVDGAKTTMEDFMLSDSPASDLGSGMPTLYTDEYETGTSLASEDFIPSSESGSGYPSTDSTFETTEDITTEPTDIRTEKSDSPTPVEEVLVSKARATDLKATSVRESKAAGSTTAQPTESTDETTTDVTDLETTSEEDSTAESTTAEPTESTDQSTTVTDLKTASEEDGETAGSTKSEPTESTEETTTADPDNKTTLLKKKQPTTTQITETTDEPMSTTADVQTESTTEPADTTDQTTASDLTTTSEEDYKTENESETAGSTTVDLTEATDQTTTSDTENASNTAESTTAGPTESTEHATTIVTDLKTTSEEESNTAESTPAGPTESTEQTPTSASDLKTTSEEESETAESTTTEPTESTEQTTTTDLKTTSEKESETSESTTAGTTESTEQTATTVPDLTSTSEEETMTAESTTTGPTESTEQTTATVTDLKSTSEEEGETVGSTTAGPTESTEQTTTSVTDLAATSEKESKTSESSTAGPTESTEHTTAVTDLKTTSKEENETAELTTAEPTQSTEETTTIADIGSTETHVTKSTAVSGASSIELTGTTQAEETTEFASTTTTKTLPAETSETTVATETSDYSTKSSITGKSLATDSSVTEEPKSTLTDITPTSESTLVTESTSVSASSESTITDKTTKTKASDFPITTTESTEETEAGSTEGLPSTTERESATASTTASTSKEETTEGSTESSIFTTEGSTSEPSTQKSDITESYTVETSSTTVIGDAVTTLGIEQTAGTSSPVASETTETGVIESSKGSTTEESSVQVITTEKSTVTTRRDWKTTFGVPHKPKCRKKKSHCANTMFGCCPDRRTPAKGPYDEGCPRPKTCKESEFGCCPDGVSSALGLFDEGCPASQCADTLFGCCLSDNKTAAEGNDQEGCPPPPPACKSSTLGCCADGQTQAKGPEQQGCPENISTQPGSSIEAESQTPSELETTTELYFTTASYEDCFTSKFGCCYDNVTSASGPAGDGCPCNATEFGCCPDDGTPATSINLEGCPTSCNTSIFGCCGDGKTPAHGPDGEGCCLLYAFGCCPDNYKPAGGPHLEGCGCQYARFGCCPDNATAAKGPNMQGCGCQYTTNGCCPDRHTEATGPEFEGCGCHTYQFGCCPDGVTIAKGPNQQGCDCRQSEFGCCGDSKTPATGPNKEGCDCASSEFGCCPDGQTEAKGHRFLGCSDIPLNRQAACSLPTDRGSCRNYSVYWYYDLEYGGCSRFWYGGCEGNGNRFATKEECEDVCVQPSPKDACNLPKVKGACMGYNVRWFYDSEREHCSQFIFGGCLGNANNFESQELCQSQCEPARTEDQCRLPIERGSCAGNFGRWGFNSETHRCEQFIWGGCEGNPNRFSSEAACLQRCDPPGTPKPQCTEGLDIGNCTEKEAVWSFSLTENRCVPFYYTGCGGNGNRFESEESCARSCPSAYVPDVCTLPAETGDCADYREKWFYDTAERRCRPFYYGGCGGNGNNFASELECEGRCSDVKVTTTVLPPQPQSSENICFREVDAGPCTELEPRWAYDYRLGRCIEFQYGGCSGNQNNFPTEEHCQYYCRPAQDICQLPMLSGPCNGSLMRWFYDPTSDSCSQFTYGGCEGNENRFDSRDDCERRCRSGPVVSTTAPTVKTTVAVESRVKETLPTECYISPSLETCVASGQVWYLDSAVGACVSHDNLESGDVCRNTGVFPTQEACERSCGAFRNINVCLYGVDPGPCQNFQIKFYFDGASESCREFPYGGCHGGPNRFSTVEECMQVCKPEIDPCKQNPEPGVCNGRYVLWYYDQSADECAQFVYGGCGGNYNRFETREECQGRCRQRPAIAVTTTTTTTTLAPTTTTRQPVAEECRTPESLAPCGDNITVYYYDQAASSCVLSQIGGCRYANSYRTEEECERRCGAFRDINVCEARLDPGPCRASIPKFYWDPASGSCQQYAYGGCGGGANRFSTIDECEEICGSTGPAAACLQAVATGSAACGAPSRRWHYSVALADCLVFAYQGCAGTDNNFLSYEECADRCKVSRFPGSNEVLPSCSGYDNECLQLVCPYGMARERTADGCTKCSCVEEIVDCSPMSAECETLRCPYGIERTRQRNGCEKCKCHDDPCLRKKCRTGENCVAIAQRDPITQEPHFSATCRPVPNEVLPDCDRFNDECSRLRCEYGVQRTRTVAGCERCTCVQVEVDCEPLRLECQRLKCNYGMEKLTGPDGCERCRCTEHPCDNKHCEPGDRCVPTPYTDPITRESKYSAECRTMNKTGYCPSEGWGDDGSSTSECTDDADCRGVGKCCARAHTRRCLVPDPATSPAAAHFTTTHAPDLPQAPQPSHETEPEVVAAEGGKATLRCIFHGNPPPKITWRRGEITIEGDVDRYRLHSDGALEIVSLYRNDSGVYICVAENSLGQARQEIQLQVSDPVKTPAGIAGDENAVLIGELGKRFLIRCLTYGYPQPTVSWHRGIYGPMVPYSSTLYEARDNVLLIRRLTYDTVGEYACQAYNGEGRPASWSVVVKAHQTDDTPTDNPYILPRIRDENEAILVRVIEATTRTEIHPITTTTSTTPEPEIDFDKPIFTVPVATRISAPYTSLTVGSELSLTCEVDGYPEPDVYWARDGKRIIPNDSVRITGTSLSRLTVSRVSLDDAGTYECHAQNAYTSHYSYEQITIQPLSIPAKCTDNPFFANCHLIVRSKFCQHKYYSKFCCKSCLEAGQLSPEEVEMQADQPLTKRK